MPFLTVSALGWEVFFFLFGGGVLKWTQKGILVLTSLLEELGELYGRAVAFLGQSGWN